MEDDLTLHNDMMDACDCTKGKWELAKSVHDGSLSIIAPCGRIISEERR
jgi:hypothetical protein